MIDIIPQHCGVDDCYQNNIIAPVSEFWDINYTPVLWADFNFINKEYHPKTFEEMSLDVGYIDIRCEIWRDFCGVSIRSQHYQVFEKFMHIIADQIKKDIPVGVTLDSNYVPWNRHFQIRPHCLLICGISEHSDEFICCDGDFHVEKRCKISTKYLYDKYSEIITFERIQVPEKTPGASIKYFIQVLQKNNPRKSYDMKKFIEGVSYCLANGDICNTNIDISKSDFLLDITNICNSRHNFKNGLQYFSFEMDQSSYAMIIELMEEICNDWETIKGLYIKSVLLNRKKYIEKGLGIIEKIEENERNFEQKLMVLLERELES